MIYPVIPHPQFGDAQSIHSYVRQKILCASLGTQITDLALKAFIPLSKLILPEIKTSKDFLDFDDSDEFRYFTPSSDLENFSSLVAILRSLKQENLPYLSRIFESLSVFKGSITDRYWKLDEDKVTFTMWSMLSYFHHAKVSVGGQFTDLFPIIERNLVRAFQKDLPLFEKIYEVELIREKLEFVEFKLLNEKINAFYGFNLTETEESFHAIANYPENDKLSEIYNKDSLSHEEKLALAQKVYNKLIKGISEERLKHVETYDEVSSLTSLQASLLQEKNQQAEHILPLLGKADLNKVKKALQGLCEYENLKIIQVYTQEFMKKDFSNKAMVQWLIVLRESCRFMVEESTLNISFSRSLANFLPMIRTLRDYFEHPEDYVLDFGKISEGEKRKKNQQIHEKIPIEIKNLAKELQGLLQERLTKMEQVLSPKICPEKKYNALLQRKKALATKQKTEEKYPLDLKAKQEVFQENFNQNYPILQLLLDSIKLSKRRTPVDDPKAHFASSLDFLIDLLETSIQPIKALTREQLDNSLKYNLGFRLEMQRRIADFFRQLQLFIQEQKTQSFINPEKFACLERLYLNLREARNFFTHDIWRKDFPSLVEAAYLLCDCKDLLQNIAAPSKKLCEAHETVFLNIAQYEFSSLGDFLQKLPSDFNVNSRDGKNRTILHFLAENPSDTHLAIAQYILGKGASIHAADYYGQRPLHYAAKSGFLELAQILIQKGAVIDIESKNGTPIQIAQFREKFELAHFLTSFRGLKRTAQAEALLDAVDSLDIKRVVLLLKKGYDPTISYQGILPLVSLFSEKESKENVPKQLIIANKLISCGADINQIQPQFLKTAIHTACEYSDDPRIIEFISILNPNYAVANSQGETPLHIAVACQRENWVREILRYPLDLDQKTKSGSTALTLACSKPRPSLPTIQLLLQRGANPNISDRFGFPLHGLADYGAEKHVQEVLSKGASPFLQGIGGCYYHILPSTAALKSGNYRIVGILNDAMQRLYDHLTLEDQQFLLRKVFRIQG